MKAYVWGGNSDIGHSLIHHWLEEGWDVRTNYKREPLVVDEPWDVLMTCVATMKPINPFLDCKFREWEDSLRVNFTDHAYLLHQALPKRNHNATVILWSGPGTNNAPKNYSAEIVGKIAQIKLCELLAAEIPDCRFVIVGPGWVKTKIHCETLDAGDKAGSNLERTKRQDKWTPMSRIVEFVDWVIKQPIEAVSGRNFSIVGDIWGDERLTETLKANPDAYKLRRHLNDWRP